MGNLNFVKDLVNTPRLTFLLPWVGISIFNFHEGKMNKSSRGQCMYQEECRGFQKAKVLIQRLSDEQGEQRKMKEHKIRSMGVMKKNLVMMKS